MSDLEIRTHSALAMDRALELGNSLDKFNRRSLHTKIGNSTSEPIPTEQVYSVAVPFIENVQMLNRNTEYSFQIPSLCKGVSIRSRKISRVKFCFESGQSALNYISIGMGGAWSSSYNIGGQTIYFQSDVADNTMEVIYYV